MGATLAQQIHHGGQGVLLSLSLGERGAPRTIPMKRYGEMQREATEKAAALIGARAIFLSYRDAEIPFNEESALAVCDVKGNQKSDAIDAVAAILDTSQTGRVYDAIGKRYGLLGRVFNLFSKYVRGGMKKNVGLEWKAA